MPEASEAELWGCDIDEASIRWMQESLCPPLHAFANAADPPLDQPDASFDLVWAISVFTHIATGWSEWLMELHRILKPEGLLLVTFMGRGMSEEIAREPWDESRVGMNVIKYGQSWDAGGPMVLHSPWWIEEHWGRAFDVVSITPDGFASKPWLDHGCVVMRPRSPRVDASALEALDPTDPREPPALAHNVEQLLREARQLRGDLDYLDSKLQESARKVNHLEAKAVEGEAARKEVARLHDVATAAQHEAATAHARSIRSAQSVLQVEENLAQARARIFALEGAVDDLSVQLERKTLLLDGLTGSISWRLTAPLRALKRLLR
jgi:SAM-dependent methyltransferase